MKRRTPLHLALLAAACLGALWLTIDPHVALGQQHTGGTGTVEIHDETERQLFWSLICSCGCPRETLGTCACDFAAARRDELRAMISEGKTVEQAQDAYVARYGAKYLAVPRNQGANRAIWAAPLLAIIGGAFFVIRTLRRWQRATQYVPTSGPAPKETKKRDAYDDKLDQELQDLDNE